MQTNLKTCKICNKTKPLAEFYKDGKIYRNQCKECHKEGKKAFYIKNRDNIRERQHELYYQGQDTAPKYKPYNKHLTIDQRKEQKRVRDSRNYQKDKARKNELNRIYRNNRRKDDINFKILCNLRTRNNMALRHNIKKGHTLVLLGCTIDQLKRYIEKQFIFGMNWDNYGFGKDKWNIDHIIPISNFDLKDIEEQKKACYYTNLQPMWQTDNLRKSNKTLTI